MSTVPPRLLALAGFAGGAVAVLTVHQALLAALHHADLAPWPAYDMAPTRPLGVPAVLSAAVWGGVWGAVLARPFGVGRSAAHGLPWARAALLGALLPTAVGALLLARGHGMRPAPGRAGAAIVAALTVNAAWGMATAAGARWLVRRRHWRLT